MAVRQLLTRPATAALDLLVDGALLRIRTAIAVDPVDADALDLLGRSRVHLFACKHRNHGCSTLLTHSASDTDSVSHSDNRRNRNTFATVDLAPTRSST